MILDLLSFCLLNNWTQGFQSCQTCWLWDFTCKLTAKKIRHFQFKNCYSSPASLELKSWVCVALVHTEVLMPQVSAVTYGFSKQTPQQSLPQLSNKQQVPQQQQVESHLMTIHCHHSRHHHCWSHSWPSYCLSWLTRMAYPEENYMKHVTIINIILLIKSLMLNNTIEVVCME